MTTGRFAAWLKKWWETIVIALTASIVITLDVVNFFANFLDADALLQVNVGVLVLSVSLFAVILVARANASERAIGTLERAVNERLDHLSQEVSVLATRGGSPHITTSAKELYDLGTDIAAQSKEHVYLLARSLILVTGPRPFKSNKKHAHEQRQYDVLSGIGGNASAGKITFHCGYVTALTKMELADADGEVVQLRLKELHERMEAPGSRFAIHAATAEGSASAFIVGDERYAMWFKDPDHEGRYVCVTGRNADVAGALVRIFEKACVRRDFDASAKALALKSPKKSGKPISIQEGS